MIYISTSELNKLRRFNPNGFNNGGYLFYKTDQILYKIFKNPFFCNRERERNVDFLKNIKIPHAILPTDKIILDGDFRGYEMNNFKDSKTFKQSSRMSNIDRLRVIKDTCIALRKIHELGLYIGDIHLDNFLYNESLVEGALIDFDYIRFPIDYGKFTEYYRIKKEYYGSFIKENANTDNIKSFAVFLSFMYEVNLEEVLAIGGIDLFKNIMSVLDIKCLGYLIDALDNFDGKITYFDELLPELKDQPIRKNRVLLKRKINETFL